MGPFIAASTGGAIERRVPLAGRKAEDGPAVGLGAAAGVRAVAEVGTAAAWFRAAASAAGTSAATRSMPGVEAGSVLRGARRAVEGTVLTFS
jgi:hypothetical protein